MQDEYFEDFEQSPWSHEFPPAVRAAGWIWCLVGVLVVLADGGFLFMSCAGQVELDPVGGCLSLFVLLVGAGFLLVSLECLRGKAKDTLANGIGSIVFGLWFAPIGGLLIFGVLSNTDEGGAFGPAVLGCIGFFGGVGLITAGVLALMGRSGYKKWRKVQRSEEDGDNVWRRLGRFVGRAFGRS